MLLIYLKLFKNTKRRSGFTLPASFSTWFLIYIYIYISAVIYYYLTNARLSLLREILGNMCVSQVVWSQILKLTISFKSSRFLYMTKKSWQKFILKSEELLRCNKNKFSSFLDGFYSSKQVFWKVRVRLQSLVIDI